jgi:hypothetical protein
VSGTVTPEAIGDEAAGTTASSPEQLAKRPRGGVAIPARLQQDVDDLAVLVDGPPPATSARPSSDDDWRKNPRFTDQNFQRNLRIVDEVQAVAAEAGATPSQIALAWLLAQGMRSPNHVVTRWAAPSDDRVSWLRGGETGRRG